MLVDYFCLC